MVRAVFGEPERMRGWLVAHLDTALRFIEADKAFRWKFGDGVVGRCVRSVLHPGFAESLRARLADLVAGRVSRVAEHAVMLGHAGVPMVVELTAVAVTGAVEPAQVVLAVRLETGGRPVDAPVRQVRLTTVTADILELVASGMPSAKVAEKLFLSNQGVDYHVRILTKKLGVANRTGMVAAAYAGGVLLTGHWPPKVNPLLVR